MDVTGDNSCMGNIDRDHNRRYRCIENDLSGMGCFSEILVIY